MSFVKLSDTCSVRADTLEGRSCPLTFLSESQENICKRRKINLCYLFRFLKLPFILFLILKFRKIKVRGNLLIWTEKCLKKMTAEVQQKYS